jgi:hypothetical protein
MHGVVHLRVVMALFVGGGCLAILQTAVSLQSPDGTTWLGAIVAPLGIILAAWLSRGSTIARALLIVLSIVGLAVYVIMFFLTVSDGWLDAVPLAVFAVLSAYCLWALTFSEDLRAELASRRERHMK